MLARFAMAIAALALMSGAASAQDDPIPDAVGLRIAEHFAAPATAAFTEAAAALEQSVAMLCETPSPDALAQSRDAFAHTVQSWGTLSTLRFGPLATENRFERIFFWPDARGVILRQVQELLAGKDITATDPTTLAEKSVAMQGLPALEYLLWGSGAETLTNDTVPYRCAYAHAVAGNLGAIAHEVEAEWQSGAAYHTAFTAPGPAVDLYRDKREVANEFVKALSTALQFMASAELGPAVGKDESAANPRRAPFWRSDLTFTFLAAQARGLDALIASTDFEDELPVNQSTVISSIRFDLRMIRERLEEIDMPVETAFYDPDAWEHLRYVTVALGLANDTVNDMLTGAIGLVMGFNALDGD
ncbi:imelysin family protein [Pelagibacterium halotolerans]|uniref:imelysin family protein n=1 Tax=Pelagibacterium halotolerans TaxID=531813 RepID=UPI00384E4C2E